MTSLKLRKAWSQFCASFEPDTMLTLATNQMWEIRDMRSLIRRFAARMDDWALGSTWARQPRERRLDGVFFIEHVGTNIHAHGLVRLPYSTPDVLRVAGEEKWERLCPAGTIDFRLIDWLPGCSRYCTKEMERRSYSQDQIVPLAEFMSLSSLSG